MGDFNIDLLKATDSSAYSNLLTSYINQPTREVFPHSSCIDHVHFRSKAKANCVTVDNCSVSPTGLSDHRAVLDRLRGLTRQPTSVIEKQTVKFVNWESLNSSLLREDWKSLLAGNNVNEIFATFYCKLNSLLVKNTKFIKKAPGKIKRNPWASDLLVRLAKQKNDLYLLVKKYPDNYYLNCKYKKL